MRDAAGAGVRRECASRSWAMEHGVDPMKQAR